MPDGRVLYTGTVVVDLLLRVGALPERGGDILASGARMVAGGGFNVMAAAARDGAEVVFAGRSGSGPFGEVVAEALWREGISVTNPPLETADNGYCVVLVDDDAERTFVTAAGAEGMLSRADLDTVRPRPGDVVYVSGYSLAHASAGPAVAGWLAELPPEACVVFDPSPLVASLDPELLESVLRRTDVLSANAREARLLRAHAHPAPAAGALRGMLRDGAVAVVRDGASGCWVATGDPAPAHLPAFPVTAVDTTGAGDAFGGVLAAALARGDAPVDAARRANAAAAIAVTRPGPATAPTAAETDALLDTH
ncbi:PfkB family carbohydrate kinase [Leifsonia shinshuensis]|uniref:PfkB family carbohydrate kinase n=1 Tax=Leifsonia shinshuensis TaxID=150026 RepID=UPI00285B893D|nr:PfkB family carbohydrate kinase [Leifsonia shinshuensis]MDR6971041.1 sugar/nucleoside kinase (ribokinase family) [Leifsonia shinshuensis]